MNQDNTTSINQQQEKSIPHLLRVKHDTEHPYVMLNRQAMRDPNLSLEAVGLWARLLSNKDDWEIHVTQLMEVNKCGRDKMYRILRELITHGYAYHAVDRAKGKYQTGTWYVFESKKSPEEIQKMFPFTENPYTVKPNTVNPTLRNTKGKNSIDKEEYVDSAPPEGDANSPTSSLSDATKKRKPPPKSPFRSVCLKERLPDHPAAEKFKNYFNKPLVGIDDRDHHELIGKYTEPVVLNAYQYLADWKLSKAETKPKVLDDHTDLHRLKKWAIKEVIENPQKVSGLSSHRKWAIGIDKTPIEPLEKRKYAWGTKGAERDKELMDFLNNVKKQPGRLGKMLNEQVDALEKEYLQYIESKGNGDELGSL